MRYFILHGHWEKDDLYAEDFKFPTYFQNYFWGKPLPKKRKKATIICKNPKDRITDLVQGLFNFVIVTGRFKAIFVELESANTEFHDIEVVTDKKSITTVYYVNIMNNVDGIDRGRSDIDVDPDDEYIITKIRKVVLRREAVQGRHAFRVQGMEAYVVISETFKSAVTSAKLTGVRFQDLAEFKSAGA